MRFPNDRLAVVAALVLATAFCVALVAARAVYVGWTFGFLVWNLFLAWVPFALAYAVYDRSKDRLAPGTMLLSALWLLFFPNGPYIVTDLLHLQDNSFAGHWFDVLIFSACAWTGMLLGLTSLYLMQSVVRRHAGAAASWIAVLAAMTLASFGIYLGRFVRWNSWDLFSQPGALLHNAWAILADPTPKTVGYTAVFTGFLTCTYLVLVSFARLAPDAERRPS
jgi:uncharacterized membrane protein